MASRMTRPNQPAAKRAQKPASARRVDAAPGAGGDQATLKMLGDDSVLRAQYAAMREAMLASQHRNENAGLVVQWLDPEPTLQSVCGLQGIIGKPDHAV